MVTDNNIPIITDVQLEVMGVQRVGLQIYTDMQTGNELPVHTVCINKILISFMNPSGSLIGLSKERPMVIIA